MKKKTEKCFAIYHRKTKKFVSCHHTGGGINRYSFSKTDPPRIYRTVGGAKSSITGGYWPDEKDKLFRLGLEIVEITVVVSILGVKSSQLFEVDKI